MRTICLLVMLAVLGGLASASAQTNQPSHSPANPPQRPQVIIVDPYGRGPPAPPERPITAPRSSEEIAPPMRRPEPLPPMLPRVGN